MAQEGLRPDINKDNTLGLVLSGGLGRRMGRINKGLVPLAGKPMARWVMDSLKAQCSEVWVSANENEAEFLALGAARVFNDLNGEHQGPLAALEALNEGVTDKAGIDWVLMAPCDVPLLPTTLLATFKEKAQDSHARAFVIKAGEQSHNTIALIQTSALATVYDYLSRGERRVWGWLDEVGVETVQWPGDPQVFANVNTKEERDALNETLNNL